MDESRIYDDDVPDLTKLRPTPAADALTDAYVSLGQSYRAGEPPLEVRYGVDERWMHWRDNLYVPEHFRAVVTDERFPFAVLDISVEQGRLVFDRISFVRSHGGSALQTRDIRRSIDGLKRESAAVVAAELRVVDGSPQLARREETIDDFLTSYDQVARERGRGAKLEDEFLRAVAATYREALAGASPRSPMKHVQQQHQGSRSSANRWVKAARDRGFLNTKED